MKTITGTWVYADSTAVANGVLYLTLSQDAVVVSTGQVAPSIIAINLTANGQIPANTSIYANDELSPSGTVYKATVVATGGGRVWGPEFLAITGVSPIDINLLVPTSTAGLVVYGSVSGLAFSLLGSGTNTTAAMVVGTGASLTVSGSGTINATTLLGNTWASPGTIGGTTPGLITGTTITATIGFSGNLTGNVTGNVSGSAGSVLFSGVGAATNANALVIGTGGSLGVSGTGTIDATTLDGKDTSETAVGNTVVVRDANAGTSLASLNDILFVDGVKYAQTLAGVQAAHDALPSTGGIVFVPSGITYDGSTTLTISKDDVQLIGAGRNTAILRQTGTSASVVKITGQRVRVENLSIRYSAAADAGVAALHVQDAGRGVYKNIHIDANIRIGLLVEATSGASAENVVRNYFDLINVPGCTDNGIVLTGGSATRRVIDQHFQQIQISSCTNDGWKINDYVQGVFVGERSIADFNGRGVNIAPTATGRTFDIFLDGLVVDATVTNENIKVVKAYDVRLTNCWLGAVPAGVYSVDLDADTDRSVIQGSYLSGNESAVAYSGIINIAGDEIQVRNNYILQGAQAPANAAIVIAAGAEINDIADNTFAGFASGKDITDSGTNTRIGPNYTDVYTGFSTFYGQALFRRNSPQVRIDGPSGQDSRLDLYRNGSLKGRLQSVDADEHLYVVNDVAAKDIILFTSTTGSTRVRRLKATEGTALVAGDFALSAGWGDTASIGTITGTDQATSFTVTAGGAGIANNPTVTLTFKDGTWTNNPIPWGNMGSTGTGAVGQVLVDTTATTMTLTWVGLPVAGLTYVFRMGVIGR